MNDLKDRLIIVRKFQGNSQKDQARELGISVTALQNYEGGWQYPGGKIFETLSRLGFSANWLLSGEGNMLRSEEAKYPKLNGIRSESVLQSDAERLDKSLLQLVIICLKPVFDDHQINDPYDQAGAINDIYSYIIDNQLVRNPETVDKFVSDIRSLFTDVVFQDKISDIGPNFLKVISKLSKLS